MFNDCEEMIKIFKTKQNQNDNNKMSMACSQLMTVKCFKK